MLKVFENRAESKMNTTCIIKGVTVKEEAVLKHEITLTLTSHHLRDASADSGQFMKEWSL